MVKVKVFEL